MGVELSVHNPSLKLQGVLVEAVDDEALQRGCEELAGESDVDRSLHLIAR